MTTSTTRSPQGSWPPAVTNPPERIITTSTGDQVKVCVAPSRNVVVDITTRYGTGSAAPLSPDEVTEVVHALVATAVDAALERAVTAALGAAARRFVPSEPAPDRSDEPIDADDPYWEPF